MASPPSTQVPFDLVDVIRGPPTRPTSYRIALRSCIKYLITPKPPPEFSDVLGVYPGFKTVPVGDWDIVNLTLDINDKFIITPTAKTQFPNATSIWHSPSIDLFELWLKRAETLGEDEDHEYSSEDLQLGEHIPSGVFPGPPSLGAAAFWNLNFEGEGNHGLTQESHIYSLIRDASIAPMFLAYLTDNHERVIGYVLEYVSARAAGIGDVDLYRATLRKLHSLGIAHGRLSSDAFLLRQDIPVAQMRSFFSAYEATNRDIFDKEMSSLEEVLQQTPPPVPVGYEQLTAF